MTNEEIIQVIKAEIESRLKNYWKICFHDVKAYNEDSNVRELKELLSFLNSLESEKPTQEEWELNSLAFLEQLGYTCIPEGAHTEKPMQEGLEDEIRSYADYCEFDFKSWDYDTLEAIANHFAEWGAEHLKK